MIIGMDGGEIEITVKFKTKKNKNEGELMKKYENNEPMAKFGLIDTHE